MSVQIDLYRKQAWWEAIKAVSIFMTGVVAVAGLILAISHIIK
jgi:hypothetical protein